VAGDYHSLALTADDQVFAWGDQPANGSLARQTVPVKLVALCGRRLVFAAAGASHNVLLVAPWA
jgi:hypothetical protein